MTRDRTERPARPRDAARGGGAARPVPAQATTEGDFVRQVLQAAVQALPALLRAEGCAILLPSAERHELRPVARRNLTEPQVQALADLLAHPEVRKLLEAGRPFLPSMPEGLPPPFLAELRRDGWPDLAAVPLPGTGRPVGVAAIVPEGDGRWVPSKLDAAIQAGELVAAALRAAVRAGEGGRRRRQAGDLIGRLPLLRERSPDRDAALARVVTGIGEAVEASHSIAVMLEPEPAFVEYLRPGVMPIGPLQQIERHPMWSLLHLGGSWSYQDAEASPADRSATEKLLNGLRPRSLVAQPIRRDGAVQGAQLTVFADRQRALNDEEQAFMRAAVAELETVLSVGQPAETAAEAATPAVQTRTLAEVADAGELGARLAEMAGREAGVEGVVVATAARPSAELHALAAWLAGGAVAAPEGGAPSGGEDLLSRALRADHAQTGGARTALPRRWRDAVRLPAAGTALALPARGMGGPVLLVLVTGEEAAVQRSAALLEAAAPTAALVLAALELRERSARREQRLTALNEVLVATSSASDVGAACRAAIAAIRRHLPAIDLVTVWVLDADGAAMHRAATSLDEVRVARLIRQLPMDLDSGASRSVRTGRTYVWSRDHPDTPESTRNWMAELGLETIVNVPMRAFDRVIGAFAIGSTTTRGYERDDLTFLEALAGQLGSQLALVEARERLDAERRRLSSLIDTLPEGIVMIGTDRRVVLHNRAAELLTGQSLAGVTLAQIDAMTTVTDLDGRPLSPEELPLPRGLAGRMTTGLEVLLSQPDGSELTLLVNGAPVYDPQGNITGALTVFQDMSAVQELAVLKNDFINTVSHELRTPITTVRGGALTLLRRRAMLDEQTQDELLTDIAEESERLHLLVEDLLSLTRSRQGINVSPEPVLLRRLVDRVIMELGGRVGSHPLTVSAPADLPPVEVDPALTQQILRNLLENAVKFSPAGQQIEVALERVDGSVMVSVLDRGSGIPVEDMDRVFEPFYRSERSVRSGKQGAGLGLAVCRRLIEMQGGRIWAEPRPGGGAAFRFTVPLAPGADED